VRVRITPGSRLAGRPMVPGDKSVAHRWLILAATATGTSRLEGLPVSLDVRSTAACLSKVNGSAGPALEAWCRNGGVGPKGHRSTWNGGDSDGVDLPLEVEGEGRNGLREPPTDLDCGNSATAMRLLAGVLAAAPFRSVLTGDESLGSRPMERVAEPLRLMGARVAVTDGHAPLVIEGGRLHGIRYETLVPTAQVKSAVLLAGLAAEGRTVVREPARTRDHTERALAALGAPVTIDDNTIGIEAFQHQGFGGSVPGDPSSAAFLVAGAALTGSEITISDVGLNPSRLHFLDVMARMGIRTEQRVSREEVGEPVGDLWVAPCDALLPVRVGETELPLVIDEVAVLALLAAHAVSDSWFLGAAELRVKESDRLTGIAGGIVSLGGRAAIQENDLVVAGGGLSGGVASHAGDHRLAMAFAVSALGASGPCEIGDMEAADVSFPGFVPLLGSLGARIDVIG
jgi:3-phosphoshikimate 1-carboxyvinyltransferase